MGFMQCGGEGIIESVCIFSHKKPFRFFIFCNFEKTKMVFAQGRESITTWFPKPRTA